MAIAPRPTTAHTPDGHRALRHTSSPSLRDDGHRAAMSLGAALDGHRATRPRRAHRRWPSASASQTHSVSLSGNTLAPGRDLHGDSTMSIDPALLASDHALLA